MRDNLRFIVVVSCLVIASSLIAVGVVCQTIALHPDAMGFIR